MRTFFAGSLLLLGLVLLGCNRDNRPKGDGGKTETPVAPDGGKSQSKGDKTGQDSGKKSDAEPKVSKVDYTLTDEELGKEADADRAAAFKKYQGKVLAVTGEVRYFDYNESLSLKGFEKGKTVGGETIMCFIKPEVLPKVCRLSEGQKITVVGKLAGSFFAIEIESITELEKSKFIVAPSTQLAKEFETDEKAASEKYGTYSFGISGTVEELTSKKIPTSVSKLCHAVLPGTANTKVLVQMKETEWARLTKGKHVELRGSFNYDKERKEIVVGAGWILPSQ